MQAISSNLPSILQLNQFAMQVDAPKLTPVAGNISQDLLNEIAATSVTSMSGSGAPFDMAMNDIASFKDVISAARDGISQMRNDATDIKDIIAQAQQGNLSQELLDKMQAEVDEKILDISIIKDAAETNGSNPYNEITGLSISDMESLMGVNGSDAVMSSMANGMTAYDMDISFDIDGVSFAGSAKIAMGMASDGSFKLAFDVSLDYDLSGLTSSGGGITSEGAPDIINNFMNMLDGQDGILAKASKIVDSAFEKIFENVNASQNTGGQGDYINSSAFLSRQIVQQSSSVLDSIMMNQMPGMALNLI